MRKKKLDPETLAVQGFETLPEGQPAQGTIHAHGTGYGPACPSACPNCRPSIDTTDP